MTHDSGHSGSPYLQLRADHFWKLLSTALEEGHCTLERFEVLAGGDLSVPNCHEVSHNVHQDCIVSVRHLAGQPFFCSLDEGRKLLDTESKEGQ